MSKTDRRRFLKGAVGVAAVGAASALVGCQPAAAPTAAPAPAPTAAAAVGAAAAAAAAPTAAPAATSAPATVKSKEQVCVFRMLQGGFAGAGPDDKLVKQVQEDALRKEYGLNVDIQFESATWADFPQLITLRFQTQSAEGESYTAARALQYIVTPGMIRDIDKEVKEYGKHLLAGIPAAAWQFFMLADQKYMALPTLRSAIHDVDFRHIRRDWLDKVNRDVPTTLEEFEECLRLFKDRKLGGNVTIPFSTENPDWMLYQFAGVWALEPATQIQYLEGAKSQTTPSNFNLERLTMLARWVKDGLMNSEWTTWKYAEVYGAAGKGMVGSIGGQWGILNGAIRTQIVKTDPTQDWVNVFPPIGLKAKPETGRLLPLPPLERGIVVGSWSKCPEAIVALSDWENTNLSNYMLARDGIEGKHWKWGPNKEFVNLKNQANPEYTGMRYTGWTVDLRNQRAKLPRPPEDADIDPYIFDRVQTNLLTRKVANVPGTGEYPGLGAVDRYCPYQFAKSQKFIADLTAMTNEYHAKMVNGSMPATAASVKEYEDKWLAAGGEVQLAETKEQWAAFIKAHPEWKEPAASFSPESWNKERKFPERPKKA